MLEQKLGRPNYKFISQFYFLDSKMSMIMTTTQLLYIQLQTGWQRPLQNSMNSRKDFLW